MPLSDTWHKATNPNAARLKSVNLISFFPFCLIFQIFFFKRKSLGAFISNHCWPPVVCRQYPDTDLKGTRPFEQITRLHPITHLLCHTNDKSQNHSTQKTGGEGKVQGCPWRQKNGKSLSKRKKRNFHWNTMKISLFTNINLLSLVGKSISVKSEIFTGEKLSSPLLWTARFSLFYNENLDFRNNGLAVICLNRAEGPSRYQRVKNLQNQFNHKMWSAKVHWDAMGLVLSPRPHLIPRKQNVLIVLLRLYYRLGDSSRVVPE